MSNRLIKKAALEAIKSQEAGLKVLNDLCKLLESTPLYQDATLADARELISLTKRYFQDSADWMAGIHEV